MLANKLGLTKFSANVLWRYLVEQQQYTFAQMRLVDKVLSDIECMLGSYRTRIKTRVLEAQVAGGGTEQLNMAAAEIEGWDESSESVDLLVDDESLQLVKAVWSTCKFPASNRGIVLSIGNVLENPQIVEVSE